MLMGALIGGVVGLVVYLVQQQQKKKSAANENLDANITNSSAALAEEDEQA